AERGLLGIALALGQLSRARLAHRHRPVGDAAHHHALDHRLAAGWRVARRAQLALLGVAQARVEIVDGRQLDPAHPRRVARRGWHSLPHGQRTCARTYFGWILSFIQTILAGGGRAWA